MGKAMEYGALDAETIADLLGVTTRQVSNYCKQRDLPSHGEGRQRTFVWKEVLAWWVDYQVSLGRHAGSGGSHTASDDEATSVPDIKHSTARKEKALADMKEIDLQKRLGQVVAMDDVARILQDVAKGLQTEILGLPSKLVEQILVLRDRNDLFVFLTDESRALCTRLATLRIGSADEIAEALESEEHPEDDEDE